MWILLVAILFIPFQLYASNVGFLKYAVITDFLKSDIQQLQKEYIHVLKTNSPGEVHDWVNSETNNSGIITVIKQYHQNEATCKRLKFKNQSKNQSAVSYFNFCLMGEEWKIVN